jgi:hypothetical protein
VIQESKNSGGISRSKKRAERTIIPALPGITTLASSAAMASQGGSTVAARSPAGIPRRKSRRLIIDSPIFHASLG